MNCKKWILVSAIFCSVVAVAERQYEAEGKFSYELPNGWNAVQDPDLNPPVSFKVVHDDETGIQITFISLTNNKNRPAKLEKYVDSFIKSDPTFQMPADKTDLETNDETEIRRIKIKSVTEDFETYHIFYCVSLDNQSLLVYCIIGTQYFDSNLEKIEGLVRSLKFEE